LVTPPPQFNPQQFCPPSQVIPPQQVYPQQQVYSYFQPNLQQGGHPQQGYFHQGSNPYSAYEHPMYKSSRPSLHQPLPFLATLDLLDLSQLTNDPISHSWLWPPIPSKLPSDIPKFDGKFGEDPQTHVMTYHLWCSSNSLNDDSIRLRIFHRTLMGSVVKWYIELPRGSYQDFNTLALAYLTHFQLLIRYETGTKLLNSLRKSTSTHISTHIHEWRRRRRLIKTTIPDQLLVDWFTKSLLPPIA